MAPGIDAISEELEIHNSAVSTLLLTVYVLGYAVGPLLLGPASEIYGRKPVLTLSNIWYLIFNIACGFARSRDQMIAFRFLAGVGGSGPLAVSWDFPSRRGVLFAEIVFNSLEEAFSAIAGMQKSAPGHSAYTHCRHYCMLHHLFRLDTH